jgi:O-methyltransferase involved in polyketide biosynthesis
MLLPARSARPATMLLPDTARTARPARSATLATGPGLAAATWPAITKNAIYRAYLNPLNGANGLSVSWGAPCWSLRHNCGRYLRRGTVLLGGALEPFDPAKPNIARVWDYWLGGKDNFAADRELARKMLEVYPLSAQMARENRMFLGRAVAYAVSRGIRQFIDVGAGLPTAVNTHDVAQSADPDTKVAYVDNDPVVIGHARALLAKSPGVIALPGDMREPAAILADPALTELIDLTKPVGLLLSGVLHFLDAGTAREVALGFTRAIAPGSYAIISVGTGRLEGAEAYSSAYTAARLYVHTPEQIAGFFDGLELVPPGLVPARGWQGEGPVLRLEPRHATFLVGMGRKAG